MAEEDNRARLKRWLESGEARLHPLSFPQRELWENSPVPAGDPANHICASIEIKGGITREEWQFVAMLAELQWFGVRRLPTWAAA